jgi:hypothetical protein
MAASVMESEVIGGEQCERSWAASVALTWRNSGGLCCMSVPAPEGRVGPYRLAWEVDATTSSVLELRSLRDRAGPKKVALESASDF